MLTSCGAKTSAVTSVAVSTPAPAAATASANSSALTVVIPANATYFEKNAADHVAVYIAKKDGEAPKIVPDSTPDNGPEIDIGLTNRDSTKKAAEKDPENDEYVILKDNDDVAVYGEGYMAAGAAASYIKGAPAKGEATAFSWEKPKSAVLLIGDGMGKNHIKAAEDDDKLDEFCARSFPAVGEAKTLNVEGGVTDSAAAGTALATGTKTTNGVLGFDKNGKRLTNIRELAEKAGKSTAVITTDIITGATPSAFTVHTKSRSNTADIKAQQSRLTKMTALSGSEGDALPVDTASILEKLGKNNKGFFFMIEEGLIDKYSHKNDLANTELCVARFDKTIEAAADYACYHPDTAVIVTADHETGGLKNDGGKWIYTTTGHTGANVYIFAAGFGAEDAFDGKTVENTQICDYIGHELGLIMS